MAPLKGLLVADFTTLLPGPLATLLLAETGAEVIKIERPGGEAGRNYRPEVNGVSAPFAVLNRGKQSIVADLKTEEGKAKAMAVVERADILVEQFRPGVMEQLGFGYDILRKRNPKLIYCSITGYGQSGLRRDEAGHDINYIGTTGLLSQSPGPNNRPTLPPALIADIGGGTFPAVINILLAIIAREKTGEGAYLDIAMTDAMFTFEWLTLATRWAEGKPVDPGTLRHFGGSARYQLYATAGGKLVACGALEQKFWDVFCKVINLPAELADDRRDPQATIEAIRAIIVGETAEHWRPIFAKADCCVTIVSTIEEALADPHFIERGLFTRKIAMPDGKIFPAVPLPLVQAFRSDEETLPFPQLSE